MAPGDTWSYDDGFDRSGCDWYTDRASHLEKLTRVHQRKLDARANAEEGRSIKWDAFESYLGRFVREVPRLMARRLVPRRFVFHVPSDPDTPYWWVSFAERAVGRSASPPADRSGITDVTEAVLSDAIRDHILHMVRGSMRIRTRIWGSAARRWREILSQAPVALGRNPVEGLTEGFVPTSRSRPPDAASLALCTPAIRLKDAQ